jgi:toxin ParE1/3/4
LIIVWDRQATENLEAQVDYIAEDNPLAALEQRDLVRARIKSLVDFPDQGRRGRIANTREMAVSGTPFVVVYRVKPRKGRVEILRVLHGAQQWPSKRRPKSADHS